VWRRAVELLHTIAVPGEWSIELALHSSHTIAAYLHALLALTALPAHTSCRPMMTLMSGALETCARALGLTVLPAHTSCRPMMTLMSGALETCAHALGTCVTSYRGRSTRLFFILEAGGPQGATGYMAASEPTSAER
jgi:hypothetical protein